MEEKLSQLVWHPSYKLNANLKIVHVDYTNVFDINSTIELANKLPKTFPYMIKPFDYAVANEYNRWNDFTTKSLEHVNPFFPFPPPLYLQFGYKIRITGKDYSSYISNPCSYNNWTTFVHDMYHKLGCSIMHTCSYSREAVNKIFQDRPLPTTAYLDTIKIDSNHCIPIWEYNDGNYKITVEVFAYKERDQYGYPITTT